jgi:hypothetical protein
MYRDLKYKVVVQEREMDGYWVQREQGTGQRWKSSWRLATFGAIIRIEVCMED